MSTSAQRLVANRLNAMVSTGPTTTVGKAIAGRNATQHGLLSSRLFLDDEDPEQFQTLIGELSASLEPIGAVELSLVERVAVTLWRQRRLVTAETATLALARQQRQIAASVSKELGRGYGSPFKTEELAPFDPGHEEWCRSAIAEIEALDVIDLTTLKARAPIVFAQLETDAEDATVDTYLSTVKGGATQYVAELMSWCQEQLRTAAKRPEILALADHARAKHLLLSADTLELFARYQTTLDNQLIKLLRALRDAQEWRLKTVQLPSANVQEIADAGRAA